MSPMARDSVGDETAQRHGRFPGTLVTLPLTLSPTNLDTKSIFAVPSSASARAISGVTGQNPLPAGGVTILSGPNDPMPMKAAGYLYTLVSIICRAVAGLLHGNRYGCGPSRRDGRLVPADGETPHPVLHWNGSSTE